MGGSTCRTINLKRTSTTLTWDGTSKRSYIASLYFSSAMLLATVYAKIGRSAATTASNAACIPMRSSRDRESSSGYRTTAETMSMRERSAALDYSVLEALYFQMPVSFPQSNKTSVCGGVGGI